MNEPFDERRAKIQREESLRWQSRLLLVLVLSSAVLGLAALVSRQPTPATIEGLAICAAFGLVVWLLKAATPLAALTGFALTSCMYLATVEQPDGGCFHTALLPGLTLFVLAFGATRFRRRTKEQSGLAESRRGRGASQVAANMGAAALAALALPLRSVPLTNPFSHGSNDPGPLILTPLVAALAEAAADTVSSEVGQAVGGSPLLLVSFRRVPAGTDGAVSILGTIAGSLAAVVVVLVAIPTLRLTPGQAATTWIAAIVGCFADSLIGATLESRGWLDNDIVNFLSTAVAALIALAAVSWLHD
jgi:uncharacterized protein (TIGR00297 family)